MLLLGVCAHTAAHQLLLVGSVTLRPLYVRFCLLPSLSFQWPHFKKGRVKELLQRRGIKVTCACPPTAANGNVTAQTCSDPSVL